MTEVEQTQSPDPAPDTMALIDLLITPPLRIRIRPGSNKTLAVSFAGVGTDPHVEPPTEFFRLAQGADGGNHVLYISDESRSWMNSPGVAEAVVAAIRSAAAEIDAERVVAIGNSMGGTMALIAAMFVEFNAVLAITPQYSAHPDLVPDERRWMRFRKRIGDFRFPAIDSAPRDGTDVTILHGGTPDELHHALKFPQSPAIHHYIFPDLDHNLARTLHRRGRLDRIVDNALSSRRWRTRRAIQMAGGASRESFEAQHKNSLS